MEKLKRSRLFKSDTFDIWGAVGLIRHDRKEGQNERELSVFQSRLSNSAATIHISV